MRGKLGVLTVVALLTIGFVGARPAAAVEAMQPPFDADYSLADLGTPPGVPASLGGLTLKNGDPTKLLIGGSANGPSGAIYEIGVTRDVNGHINGFSGTATLFATAPYIDGGLAYAPNGGLLYTAYPTHEIGMIKPGSTAPDKVVTAPGPSSVGSLGFVPATHPGGGLFKVASYLSGTMYSAALTDDGAGTFDIGPATDPVSVGGGPEGIAYVPLGSPQFPDPSVLLTHYSTGQVVAYEVDANGNPDPTSSRPFVAGLSGAEGAFLDVDGGDFLFSTFGGGNRVVVVGGFTPPPTLRIGDVLLTEGNATQNAGAQLGLRLSEPLATTHCAYFHTVDGTATGAAKATIHDGSHDYLVKTPAKPGVAKFPAGKVVANATTTVLYDTDPESSETYDVVIDKITDTTGTTCNAAQDPGVAIGDSTGTVSIIDDDPGTGEPTLTIGDRTVVEGNATQNASASLGLRLSQPLATAHCVYFHTVELSATGAANAKVHDGSHDYVVKTLAKPGVAKFAAGKVVANATTVVLYDTDPEGDEFYDVRIDKITDTTGTSCQTASDPAVYIADVTGRVTITNDD
jgi:hypothetical protein